MCVVSMVMDHYTDKWKQIPTHPYGESFQWPTPPPISQEEIAEFRKLLERAREYDKKNNEPDCELNEKKETLKKLAKELGVEITFL